MKNWPRLVACSLHELKCNYRTVLRNWQNTCTCPKSLDLSPGSSYIFTDSSTHLVTTYVALKSGNYLVETKNIFINQALHWNNCIRRKQYDWFIHNYRLICFIFLLRKFCFVLSFVIELFTVCPSIPTWSSYSISHFIGIILLTNDTNILKKKEKKLLLDTSNAVSRSSLTDSYSINAISVYC